MAAAAETETPAAAVAALLTGETVPAYLSKMGVFGSSTAVTAKAIVGGNINYAFQGSIHIQQGYSAIPSPMSHLNLNLCCSVVCLSCRTLRKMYNLISICSSIFNLEVLKWV